MIRNAIKYGLIIGFGFCVWINLEHLAGLHTSHLTAGKYFHFFTYIIFLLGLYFGIREQRDIEYNGYMKYPDALKTGLLITLSATFFIFGIIYVYAEFINPDLLDIMVLQTKNAGKSEIETNLNLQHIYKAYSTTGRVVRQFSETIITGVVASFIFPFLLRNKNS